jgi:hypothetical protein
LAISKKNPRPGRTSRKSVVNAKFDAANPRAAGTAPEPEDWKIFHIQSARLVL